METGRRNLLTFLEDMERRREALACLWMEGVRWRRRRWGELRERALGCAQILHDFGLEEGGCVLVMGPAGAPWIEALFGVLRAGGVVVPLDEGSPAGFVETVAGKTGARLFIGPAVLQPPAGLRHIPWGDWDRAGVSGLPDLDPDTEARAQILFTSGTTGDPKGVILTHGNLTSDLAPFEKMFQKRESLLRHLPLRVVCTLPLSHMFGQMVGVYGALSMGATVVFAPPRPREVLHAVRAHRCVALVCVPRMLDLLRGELLRWKDRAGRRKRFLERVDRLAGRPLALQLLSSADVTQFLGWTLRIFIVGGAALPADLQRFWEALGYLVGQGYGLTETAPIVALSNPFRRGTGAGGAVGRPLPGQEVRIGSDGEVWVRGPNVTPGYFGGSDEGSFEDGWFRTGDLGEMDDVGRLHIRGRRKDVIVTPEGENVHASDVEAVLRALPGVQEAAVVGVPRALGDDVHAVLIVEPRRSAGDLVQAANARLEPRQRIRGATLWPRSDFPRTPTGKIRKAEVLKFAVAVAAGATGEDALSGASGDVRQILSRLARVPRARVRDDVTLSEGLGLASLDLVELVAELEDAHGVALSEEDLAGITVAGLESRLAEARHCRGAAVPPALPEETAGTRPRATPEPEAPEPVRQRRGSVRMPRWARALPAHLCRRMFDELILRPLIFLYARPRVEGRERLRALQTPFFLVSTHHSFLDTALHQSLLPYRLRGRVAPGMTTRHHGVWFGHRIGGLLAYLKEGLQVRLLQLLFHAWPLPESSGVLESLLYAGELADSGFSPLVFPEGRHVPEGSVAPFRKGTGLFARDLRLPVVPALVEGSSSVLPEGAWWFRLGRVRIRYGVPFSLPEGITPEEATRLVEAAVRSLAAPQQP